MTIGRPDSNHVRVDYDAHNHTLTVSFIQADDKVYQQRGYFGNDAPLMWTRIRDWTRDGVLPG